jgi:iron complex outermembrane receptor protein
MARQTSLAAGALLPAVARTLLLAVGALSLARECRATEQPAVPDDLTRLSLSDLANVEVTSVSKSSESLQRAPASIYVITHEAIERSSASNVFELLRLAPNLLVTQLSATSYVVASRGFGGNPNVQNFANKILMLVDGRSVYSPLYSGIYSDALDLMLEDIEKIEVISGPGATLWGANAMNGVINIVTRATYLTTGTFVAVGAGNNQQNAGVRYGGHAGEDATFRVYGMGFQRAALDSSSGGSAHDGWSKGQGGFRYDWSRDPDSVSVQGDIYRATQNMAGTQDGVVLGGNIVARYQHHGDRSDLQVQAYYDQTEQQAPGAGGGFLLDTYDVEFQQNLSLGAYNRLIWGGGERLNRYSITNAQSLLFIPFSRNLTLGNIFIQDTVSISAALNLDLGFKLEDDPFSGWTPLPDVRASWQLTDHAALWAAASRAIRSPTPFDADVVEKLNGMVYLTGNTLFRPENLYAYEAGTRIQWSSTVSLSVAAFYNDYDDLKTIEPTPVAVLPLRWGNLMHGDTFGIEAWANWQITPWWRLSPSFTWQREHFSFKRGASALVSVAQAADDPSSHAALTSSVDLPHNVTLDAAVRYVGALPDPALQSYYEMDLRCGWHVMPGWEVSISGNNLLHAQHSEFPAPNGENISRSVFAETRWRF